VRIMPPLIAATLVGFAFTPAAGGSIGATEVSPSLAWESECNSPVQPALILNDIRDYNQALATYNSYVAQVGRYIQCVQTEGQADIDTLAGAVSGGMQEKQNAAINSAEELRKKLQEQRSSFR